MFLFFPQSLYKSHQTPPPRSFPQAPNIIWVSMHSALAAALLAAALVHPAAAVFAPADKEALQNAVTACLNENAKGDCKDLAKTHGIMSQWDVSRVTDMSRLFQHQAEFDADLSFWDVSQVTNMVSMFESAVAFNCDLSAWDVSQVQDMSGSKLTVRFLCLRPSLCRGRFVMILCLSLICFFLFLVFVNAQSFNQDLSAWNVGEVTNMDHSEWSVRFLVLLVGRVIL